jgi:hypothetical protein
MKLLYSSSSHSACWMPMRLQTMKYFSFGTLQTHGAGLSGVLLGYPPKEMRLMTRTEGRPRESSPLADWARARAFLLDLQTAFVAELHFMTGANILSLWVVRTWR